MKDIAVQKIGSDTLRCYSQEDIDEIADFPELKILRAQVTGVLKPRSYQQLKLYHSLCRKVADNTDDPNWNTKQKTDFQVKVACRLIDEFVVVNGVTHMVVGSVSYKKMGHLLACNFFDRAFVEMAKFLNITVDELLDNAE